MSRDSGRSGQRRSKRDTRIAGAKSRIAALLVLPLALLLAWGGARAGLSGIASFQAEAFLADWESKRVEPDARAWQVAHAAAQRSIALYPVADGERLDRLGRIYSWQQFRQPYAVAEAAESRQAALDAYRAAVAVRPTWPYSWARLAHTKLYQQDFDGEFADALNQAFQRGPWRVRVNSELAEIGFGAWGQLSQAQRQATLESARRSVAYGMNEARYQLEVAQHSGRLRELCSGLSPEMIALRKLTICLN